MTLFEYLAIAFSLVLSFSAMRLVAGLPYATQKAERYWVHLVFVFSQLLVTVVAFWNLWSFREATWTLPRFVLVLTIPGAIYFGACTLIPNEPSSVDSWRAHYYVMRQRFFMAILASIVAISLSLAVVSELPWLDMARLPQAAGVGVALLGIFSADARVHSGLALLLLVVLLVSASSVYLVPGSVTP